MQRAARRLAEMFERFWDDRDFLLIEEIQDMPPDRVRPSKDFIRLPEEALAPIYAALERWHASPAVAANLAGLLTGAEILRAMSLLRTDVQILYECVPVAEPGGPSNPLIGLDDRHHAIMVGPCNPDVAEAEARCPLVAVIEVAREHVFDCSYEQWVKLLRGDVQQAAQEVPSRTLQPTGQPSDDAGLAERVNRAMTDGLKDGARIVAKSNGWVVVDSFNAHLCDPEEASWVFGNHRDMPPAVFPTPAEAYRAWERTEEVGKARNDRRVEALKRIGKR